MTDSEAAWMAEHKGPLLRTIAEVWWCGDDWCGCTQPQIVDVHRNLKVPIAVVRVAVWSGTFRSDHETGAEEELAAKRAELLTSDPAMEARIQWPADSGERA